MIRSARSPIVTIEYRMKGTEEKEMNYLRENRSEAGGQGMVPRFGAAGTAKIANRQAY